MKKGTSRPICVDLHQDSRNSICSKMRFLFLYQVVFSNFPSNQGSFDSSLGDVYFHMKYGSSSNRDDAGEGSIFLASTAPQPEMPSSLECMAGDLQCQELTGRDGSICNYRDGNYCTEYPEVSCSCDEGTRLSRCDEGHDFCLGVVGKDSSCMQHSDGVNRCAGSTTQCFCSSAEEPELKREEVRDDDKANKKSKDEIIEEGEKVLVKNVNKVTFMVLCAVYSLVETILFHPLSVATAVSELHEKKRIVRTEYRKSWWYKLTRSFRGNLTIREAMEKIVSGSQGGRASMCLYPSKLRYYRLVTSALFTGLPVSYCGAVFHRVFQMIPYNYLNSWLTEKQREGLIPSWLPAPAIAGAASTILYTPLVNPCTVISRQQVSLRCTGQPHDFVYVVARKLPEMEGGLVKVLMRGTVVAVLGSVPSHVLGWQVYESTKNALVKKLEFDREDSVLVSAVAGTAAGVAKDTLGRPISVVVSRMQTETRSRRFIFTAKELLRAEGIGALYKGYWARILTTAPRTALFFIGYQSIVNQASSSE